ADIHARVKIFIEEEATAMLESSLVTTDQFEDVIKSVFPFDDAALDRLFDAEASKVRDVLITEAKELYDAKEAAFTSDILRKIERDVYLQVLDNLWMRHLEAMDHLREGIHWMS